MSGPKVVRIVTREEFIAICAGHLTRLDVAVGEWTRVGRRNEVVTDEEVGATEGRAQELHRALEEGRFDNLEKQILTEIAFLERDQEHRLSLATERRVSARVQARRAQSAAARLLESLDIAGRAVPPTLRVALEEAASGRGDADTALREGFELLTATPAGSITDRQRELAAGLREGTEERSFEAWCAANVRDTPGSRLAEIDRRLAELATTVGEEAVAEFEARIATARTASHSRHALLVDSLTADLSARVAVARERAALELRLRMLAGELEQAGTERCLAAANEARRAIEGGSNGLAQLEAKAETVLAEARTEVASRARRQAVLAGLASLGYEVGEALETALARDGRVVAKKTADPGYGVEVAAPGSGERLQMRTVAFRAAGAVGDGDHDRNAEVRFCDDVASLRAFLAESGGDLTIEQARPVGTTPLKVVAVDSDRRDEVVRAPQIRTLP